MNSVKVENVVPLQLEFNEYAEATDILGGRSPHDFNQVLEVQDCIVYSTKSFCCPFGVFQIYQLLYSFLLVEVE